MHGISARLGVVSRRSVVVSVRRICVTGIDLSHHAPTNKTLRRVRIGVLGVYHRCDLLYDMLVVVNPFGFSSLHASILRRSRV